MLLRARLLRCLLLGALAAAVVPVGALAATPGDASRNLLTRAWTDGRFVVSAECLGIDGDGLVTATRFACLSNVARRPANVPQARWDYYLSLVKAGNAAGVARFLGIPRGASRVQVKRIYDRWNKAVWKETMLGVRTPAAGQWEVEPAALSTSDYTNARYGMNVLNRLTHSVELYRASHEGYAGMNLAALRLLDRLLIGDMFAQVVFARADEKSFCVQLTSSGVTVRATQDGPAVSGPCA